MGDILKTLDGAEIDDLRGLSELLKQYTPGDRVEILVLRGGQRVTLVAELAQK